MTNKNKTSGKDKTAPASTSDKETSASTDKTSTNNASTNNASTKNNNPAPSNEVKKTSDQTSPKKEKTNSDVKKETSEEKKGCKGGFGLSFLALSLVIASSAGIYYYGNQEIVKYDAKIDALTSSFTSKINSLQAEQARSNEKSQALIQKNKQDMQVLVFQQDNSIRSLQLALADMKGRRPNEWRIAEADYLVNLAGRQLWIMRDALTATTLMETADQRLATLNDPSLTPIRQAIAQDIQQLKSIVHIDVDGIVLRLNSLQQEVDRLPLSNAFLPEAQAITPDVVSTNVNDWKDNLKASLNDFVDQFITYRKREGDVIPLLTPAQTFYLQENLKAKLNQAITAVYRENNTLYNESLNTAKEWTKRFFDQDSQITQSFLSSLDFLDKQRIQVQYPQALISQQLISDQLAERLQHDLSPMPTEEKPQ